MRCRPYVNSRSPRVRVGLGTIARVVATGEEIYARKLRFAEAVERVERLYRPYHRALKQLLRRDARALRLLSPGRLPLDAVLDRTGRARQSRAAAPTSCWAIATAPRAIRSSSRRRIALLRAKGYQVARNTPYAGGFTTAHYGKPHEGGHGLQIELSRGLYMDERSFDRKPFLARLAADMRELLAALAAIDPAVLRPT